jgi:hypothetical protein
MKSIEEMIFETRFKGEEFDANDYNDWAKENEWEAYTICLSIAKQLLQHGVMQAEGSAFDCSKYNKREGQSCDLNNNCRYPNCAEGATVGNSAAGKGLSGGLYCGCTVPNRNTTRVNWCGTCNRMICA